MKIINLHSKIAKYNFGIPLFLVNRNRDKKLPIYTALLFL